MKCPQCGKEIRDSTQRCRPFCSDRCKLIDLGKWILEEYRVAAVETDESDFEDPATMNDSGEE